LPKNKLALLLYERTRAFSTADSVGLPTLSALDWVREDFRKALKLSEEEVALLTRKVAILHSYIYPDEMLRIRDARRKALEG